MVACFYEGVVACLDEVVMECLDKNNKDGFYMDFILAHPFFRETWEDNIYSTMVIQRKLVDMRPMSPYLAITKRKT